MPVQSHDPALIFEKPVVVVGGPTGALGATGATGLEGPPSAPGPTGSVGATGPSGIEGATGLPMVTGPTGPRGPTGAIQLDGGTGAQGDGGDDGSDGPTGVTGDVGPSGPTGARLAPKGPPSAVTGPTGAGSICVSQVPFFADPNVYMTFPLLDVNLVNSPFAIGNILVNAIVLMPIFIPYSRTFTSMAVEIGPGYTDSEFRMGIYDCDHNMQPLAPLFDSGSHFPTGTGLFAVSFSLALQQRPYLMAYWGGLFALPAKIISSPQIVNTLGMKKYPPAEASQWQFSMAFMLYSNQTYGPPFPDLTGVAPSSFDYGNYLIQGIR